MATNPLNTSGYPPKSTAWCAIVVFTFVATSVQGDKSVMALLFEPVRAGLGLSDTQMGLIQGTSGGLAFLLASIPIGLWVDRGHRIVILAVGSVLWSTGTLATAFCSGFTGLFLARLLVGIGSIVVNPTGISLVADWLQAKDRALANSVISAGAGLGTAFGTAAGGALLAAVTLHPLWSGGTNHFAPWRTVNISFGVIAFAMTAALLLIKEPQRKDIALIDARVVTRFNRLWQYRRFLLPLICGMTCSLTQFMSVSIWTPATLGRVFSLQPQQFSSWLGAVTLLASVGGSLVGGGISRLTSRGQVRDLMVTAASLSLIAIPFALYALSYSLVVFALLLAVLFLANCAARILVTTALTTQMPNELRGLAMGVDTICSASIGLGVAPALVGWVSDRLGGGGAIVWSLASVCSLSGAGSAFFFWRAACNSAHPAPAPAVSLPADH